jgi:hypothetical protein
MEKSVRDAECSAGLLLHSAREALVAEFGDSDKLPRAAVHLVECALAVVELLPKGDDVDTAREALSSARAAVQTATVVVRSVHDTGRRPPPQ